MAKFFFGPEGGSGGKPFNDDNPNAPNGAWTKIQIRSGRYIDALIVTYESGLTFQHGGDGGQVTAEFQLTQGEVIQSISGRHGSYVDQLTFVTSLRTLGPFGGFGGSPWRFDIPPTLTLTSFFGGSGTYLDAIGFTASDGAG